MTKKLLILFGVALAVVLLDQGTKHLAVAELTTRFDGLAGLPAKLGAQYSTENVWRSPDGYHFRARRSVTVFEQYLRLRYAENPGAAWGLFRGLDEKVRGPLFHLVSIAAVVLITFYFLRLGGHPREKWAVMGLPLVLGGAIGNYVDRLSRGFVIDFIEMHWQNRHFWPSYNVADMAIVAGVLLLMLDALVRREPKAVKAAAET